MKAILLYEDKDTFQYFKERGLFGAFKNQDYYVILLLDKSEPMDKAKIQEVIDTIIAGYGPSKIILFGSYAKGTASESSDLDLLIIKETDEPKYKRVVTVRKLFHAQPCAMDILVYTPKEYHQLLNYKSLIPYIATKEGKILYETGN